MRSIRFSDQVLSNEDVSLLDHAATRRQNFALHHHQTSYDGGEYANGARPPSRRSLDRGQYRSRYSKAPSVAASDTSSAAGFGRQSSLDGGYSRRGQFRRQPTALSRTYGSESGYGNNALYPRSTQDYLDELDYRGTLAGRVLEAAAPSLIAGSSSPYSARSAGESSDFSQATTALAAPAPILKNGTLTRSHSRASSVRNGATTYNNGNLANGYKNYGARSVNGAGSSSVDSVGFVREAVPAAPNSMPPVPPMPRSRSQPVIASNARQPTCGDCAVLYAKMTGRAEPGQPFPIGVLMCIFLVFSAVIVSSIMIYLRGGGIFL